MKITKPKENQILLEDEAFKKFTLDVKSKSGLKDSEFDEEYEGLLLAYRQPGMDASKQIMFGSQISILTLTCSLIENIIRYELLTEEQLMDTLKEIFENARRG